MSDKNEMELIADCHGVTEPAHELVTSLSVEVFHEALQTEQKIGSWREALENEMNL